MLTETEQAFLVELRGCDGGLTLMESHPLTPTQHRFQGGLLYSTMIEVAGRVLAPEPLVGHPMRVWVNQLPRQRRPRRLPDIGDIYDRTGELPGGGLEVMLFIPEAAWLPSIHCLGTTWRRLTIRGVEGDGRRMRLVDFSFTADRLGTA